jgi:hypothetical protein
MAEVFLSKALGLICDNSRCEEEYLVLRKINERVGRARQVDEAICFGILTVKLGGHWNTRS